MHQNKRKRIKNVLNNNVSFGIKFKDAHIFTYSETKVCEQIMRAWVEFWFMIENIPGYQNRAFVKDLLLYMFTFMPGANDSDFNNARYTTGYKINIQLSVFKCLI